MGNIDETTELLRCAADLAGTEQMPLSVAAELLGYPPNSRLFDRAMSAYLDVEGAPVRDDNAKYRDRLLEAALRLEQETP